MHCGREPPHVGGNIRIAGAESNQEIGRIVIEPFRERPPWHHDAEHARLDRDLMGETSFGQIRDVGLRESHVHAIP